MKALWQGAAQYIDILDTIRKSKKFWNQLSESILLISRKEVPLQTNLPEKEAQKLAFEYHCQSAALDIIASEIFLQKKLIHAQSLVRQTDHCSKGGSGTGTNAQVSANAGMLEDILLSWSDSSSLIVLLKSSAVCTYDSQVYLHGKVSFLH